MTRWLVLIATVVTAFTCGSVAAFAEPSTPAPEVRQPPGAVNVDGDYDRGVRARVMKDWPTAIDAFRKVVARRADFPDAWNELGFALRNVRRYPEALAAYAEALRLRPEFPEALEYLGEAYVDLGRLDDARKILVRLRKVDTRRAQELADVIGKAR
jgi:tetratricopeptide (TPR) repeat protein